MPLDNGTFAFTAFRLPQKIEGGNDAIIEQLQAFAAKRLDTLGEEEECGWVSWRYLLENELDDANAILGRYPFFNLRAASRKMPAALLRAECRMRELRYMQENAYSRISSKKRKEIKEDIIRMRLPSMPPSISGVQIALDNERGYCWVGSASGKVLKTFIQLFQKTFGFEPEILSIPYLLFKNLQKIPSDLGSISYGENDNQDFDFPGRDFLTWLWYKSESTNDGFKVDTGIPAYLTVEGPLTLIAVSEGKGAGETCLRKGLPTKSAEVKTALRIGKKLRKAKISLVKQEPFTFSFDADKFAFSGLSLPEGESMDEAERFDDRMDKIFAFTKMIEAMFIEYATIMTNEVEAKKLEQEINDWIEKREGY